jgi:hypothetical protein
MIDELRQMLKEVVITSFKTRPHTRLQELDKTTGIFFSRKSASRAQILIQNLTSTE